MCSIVKLPGGTPGRAADSHDVELEFVRQVEGFDVGCGGAHHCELFPAVDGRYGIVHAGIAACLHFYDGQTRPALCHDVYLHASAAPVAVDYGIAFGGEHFHGSVFARAAGVVVACHQSRGFTMSVAISEPVKMLRAVRATSSAVTARRRASSLSGLSRCISAAARRRAMLSGDISSAA